MNNVHGRVNGLAELPHLKFWRQWQCGDSRASVYTTSNGHQFSFPPASSVPTSSPMTCPPVRHPHANPTVWVPGAASVKDQAEETSLFRHTNCHPGTGIVHNLVRDVGAIRLLGEGVAGWAHWRAGVQYGYRAKQCGEVLNALNGEGKWKSFAAELAAVTNSRKSVASNARRSA
ncbi:hypothetical protein SCAR479_06975 [Seiridium cardinale]|uniref:Uncharacterized protein n=1 Tax=Seiridium cardinale TaxID=138064 RepID=A0ABR2XRF0_9PEZI